MKNKVLETIEKYNMLDKGNSIVIGVSGGADSMALLYFFLSIRDEMNLKIIVAHINHCLRGEESDRDQDFVLDYCKKNDVEVHVLTVDVKKEAQIQKKSIEDCARNIRYKFFSELATKENAKIATAHSLSDSVETTIFNMIRGTGTRGLSGISAVRGNIIRPFIFVSRSQIEEYCNKNELKYITDSSNLSHDYTRNKIRLDIIPLMKNINPSFETSVLRLREQIDEENEYLNNIANLKLLEAKVDDGYDLEIISGLKKPIMSRFIISAVYNETGVYLLKSHIDLITEIINNSTGSVTIPGKIYVKIERNILKIKNELIENKYWESELNSNKILTETGRTFIIENINIEDYHSLLKKQKNLFYNAIDYDTMGEKAVLRNRRPGDKFSQKNRGNTKSLKKIFNERKIPLSQRNNLAILADENGVLWIEGIGVSEEAAVSQDTKNVIIIFTGENEYDKKY